MSIEPKEMYLKRKVLKYQIKNEKNSFTKMWFEPIFLSGSLAVFKFAAKPLKLKFWGLAVLAATGGEMRPNYFKYTQPPRKSQIRLAPFAGLGNQIERNFGLKNQLAVLSELNSK